MRGRDPFPIVVDSAEMGDSDTCGDGETAEKPDDHRQGPFLADGTGADDHGIKGGRKDPNKEVAKNEFEAGPGKWKR